MVDRALSFSRRLLKACLLLLLGLSARGIVHGQDYQYFSTLLNEIEMNTRWNVGPARISSQFQIRNIGFDSNIYQMSKAANPVSDYTGALSLPTKVYLNYRNGFVFSLAVTPEYSFYASHKLERAFNSQLVPELRARLFGNLILSAKYEFDRSRRRPTSEFDVRARVKSNIYQGSVFIETARLTAIGFTGSIQEMRFEDIYLPEEESPVPMRLNRDQREGRLEFYYRLYSDTVFFLSGGYAEYDFLHPSSYFRNSYSYQAYSGLRFPLLGWIRGAVNLGYKSLIPRTRGIDGFSGLVGDTSFDMRLSQFLFRILYSRDCNFSYSQQYLFFVDEIFGAGISFYPTLFLRLDYDYRSGRSRFPGLISVALPEGGVQEIERLDRTHSHIISLVYRVVGDIGIGLTGNFWQRRSNNTLVNRDRFFVGAFLTYEF